jgi:hypothetical protein
VFLGRLVQPGEPLWLDDDRDWALALTEYENDICDGCGQPRSQTTAPEAEYAYRAVAIRCHGCKTAAGATEPFTSPGATTAGLLIAVTRRSEG